MQMPHTYNEEPVSHSNKKANTPNVLIIVIRITSDSFSSFFL